MEIQWAQVGKFLSGACAAAAALFTALLAYNQQKADLEAYLKYDYQNYPAQFLDRLEEVHALVEYERLYDGYQSILRDAASHEQLHAITRETQSIYGRLRTNPFERGIDEYGSSLFIYLKNRGDKAAEDVYVKLPAKGLVLVRDDSKNYETIPDKTNDVRISSIVQNGDAKIWVYFDAHHPDVVASSINIGHKEGFADVHIYEDYKGVDAWVAKNSELMIYLVVVLVVALAGLLSISTFSEEESDKDRAQGSAKTPKPAA